MSERKCHTCAWWEDTEALADDVEGWRIIDGCNREGVCHYDPSSISKSAFDWCRHWSETTGWDQLKEQPTQLEQKAQILIQSAWMNFGKDHPNYKIYREWLEEYRRNC